MIPPERRRACGNRRSGERPRPAVRPTPPLIALLRKTSSSRAASRDLTPAGPLLGMERPRNADRVRAMNMSDSGRGRGWGRRWIGGVAMVCAMACNAASGDDDADEGGSTASDPTDTGTPDPDDSDTGGAERGATTGAADETTGNGDGDSTGGDPTADDTTGSPDGDSTGTGGRVEPVCDDVTEMVVAWETIEDDDLDVPVRVFVDDASTPYVTSGPEIRALGPDGEVASTWDLGVPGLTLGAFLSPPLRRHPSGDSIAIGNLGGTIWVARLDLAGEAIVWSDALDLDGGVDSAENLTVAPDGSLFVTGGHVGPPRQISVARYGEDGDLLWAELVPNDVPGLAPNDMRPAFIVATDDEAVVVNRSAVVLHRFDYEGNYLGHFLDNLFGSTGLPRWAGLDHDGQLMISVTDSNTLPGADSTIDIRRYGTDYNGEWLLDFDDVNGWTAEHPIAFDADGALLYGNAHADPHQFHKIVDGRITYTQEIEGDIVLDLATVDDCSFVLTGRNGSLGPIKSTLMLWRRRYDPA